MCFWNCELNLDLTINRVFDLDEGGHGGETIKDFSSASRPPPWSNRSIRPRQSIRQSTDKREALYLTTEPKHDLQLLHRHGCCWLSVYRLSVRARSLKVQDLFGLLFLFSESLSILRVSQFWSRSSVLLPSATFSWFPVTICLFHGTNRWFKFSLMSTEESVFRGESSLLDDLFSDSSFYLSALFLAFPQTLSSLVWSNRNRN